MARITRVGTAAGLELAIFLGFLAVGRGDETSPAREIPAPLAPLEYLVGGWKGTGIPTANPIKGWNERHAWAWAFAKGAPVGLTAELTGNKLLTRARLTHDPANNSYMLTGTTPDGRPATFTGTFDASAKTLVLDRDGPAPDGSRQRLAMYPNSNAVRYTLRLSERAPGSPQYKETVRVGLTKEGEAFAATGGATEPPKCIVTGSNASMTVSYQGKSYPLCCTGCRDEFVENPEKYIKKASLIATKDAKTGAKPRTSPVMKDDGAFDGLGDDTKPRTTATATTPVSQNASTPKSASATKPAPGKAADRAASLLKIGQNLEKSGKTAAALGYYRRVVKEFPDTPAAKTAAARVKVLGPE